MIYDKNGRIDARNALGIWSGIKFIVDSLLIITSLITGTLAAKYVMAIPKELTAAAIVGGLFILWSIAKEAIDAPLVILWARGKWSHVQRKKKQIRRKRK
jgi:hypothetical protein